MKKVVVWWSAGITSAVSGKLAIEKYGIENVELFYFLIGSAHPDNERFIKECEEWYGKKINIRKSQKYEDQFDVIDKTGYINGPSGARCTKELKKEVRFQIEREFQFDAQIFGFEHQRKEINRALRFLEEYPAAKAEFPLIENGMDKAACLFFLEKAGIKRPEMYSLGFPNNNCIGCVKGGAGYWNLIRTHFPESFNRMASLERSVGRTCLRKKVAVDGEKVSVPLYLDELDENAGRNMEIIMPDCGSFCDLELENIEHELLDQVEENGQTVLELYDMNIFVA